MQQANIPSQQETGPEGSIFLSPLDDSVRTDRDSVRIQLMLGRGLAKGMDEQERLEVGEALGIIQPRQALGDFALRVAE